MLRRGPWPSVLALAKASASSSTDTVPEPSSSAPLLISPLAEMPMWSKCAEITITSSFLSLPSKKPITFSVCTMSSLRSALMVRVFSGNFAATLVPFLRASFLSLLSFFSLTPNKSAAAKPDTVMAALPLMFSE